MTQDTTPAAVERLSPYAINGGRDAFAEMETDPQGDYVTYDAYAALSAQLEAANARAYSLAYAIAGGEDVPGLLDSVNTDELCKMLKSQRAWAQDAEFSVRAEGKAEGLREAAACLGHITRSEDLDAILALIPADTPAAKVTVQEAASVLLGDEYTSPLLDVLDAYNNDYDVGQDVLKALRAIAGCRDE